MDNQRFFIWAVFGFMCLLNYQAWIQQDAQNYQYMDRSVETARDTEQNNQTRLEENVPEIIDMQTSPNNRDAGLQQINETLGTDIVKIKTDVLEMSVNLVGATIQEIKLLNYPISKDKPDDLVELINQSINNYGLIQSGVRSSDKKLEANHLVKFSSVSKNYVLSFDGEMIVPFMWESGDGVSVEKRFILKQGSYNIRLEQIVR
jgi:YidC/Oxa1 family membrane protein insertase